MLERHARGSGHDDGDHVSAPPPLVGPNRKRPLPRLTSVPEPSPGPDPREDGTEGSPRLFLVGPTRSGKTSLAMDLAYSAASKVRSRLSCRGCGAGRGGGRADASVGGDGGLPSRPSSSGSAVSAASSTVSASSSVGLDRRRCAEVGGESTACRCVAVTFLAHASARTGGGGGTSDGGAGDNDGEQDGTEYFPLRCRPMPGRSNDGRDTDEELTRDVAAMTEEELFEMRMLEIEEQAEKERRRRASGCEGETTDDEDGSSEWDEGILNSIQVKYVSSAHEVLRFLAGAQALPQHLRPLGGIILDDLHLFARGHDSVAAGESSEARTERSGTVGTDGGNITVQSLQVTLTAEEAIRAGQILAFLADTGDFLEDDLERLLEREEQTEASREEEKIMVGGGVALLATSHSAPLPPHFARSLARNYLPALASVRPAAISDGEEEEEFCVSRWELDLEFDAYGVGCDVICGLKKKGAVMFGVTEDGDEGLPEICWSQK